MIEWGCIVWNEYDEWLEVKRQKWCGFASGITDWDEFT